MQDERKIILLDFDGVIADSYDVAFKINKIIDNRIKNEKDFQKLFNGNINDWTKDSSCTKEEIRIINDNFFAKYIPQMKKVKIFSGIKDVLMGLSKKYTLLIISSTIISPIHDLLKRNNVHSYFDDIVGSNFVDANKTERMKMVLKKYEVETKDCIFVTDTLGDIKEATNVGIDSIGVAWGFQERENLLKGKPFAIAEKPKELLDIVSDYFKQK